ncbi:MAG: hypothetical protein GX041_03320 [Clostridiales bacterium]|jgi:hypothetical protein|nr:hypothetical protein [Clostridiales bacterium]
MKIRQECSLARLHANSKRVILANSPELKFVNALCSGLVDEAVGYFREKKLFGNHPPVVDAPYGRFEGLSEIRKFAEGWLDTFNAQSASVLPVVQTRANGRSVSEVVINFVVDGQINQVPMFVVGDLRTPDTLDEVRMYCHFTYVPGLTAYRKPIFTPAHLEMGDPALLSGAVREYYEALHHVPSVDVDRIMGSIGKDCIFGGYEPIKDVQHDLDSYKKDIRSKFEHMKTYIPSCVGMRYERITDDNVTCVIEWVHIVSEKGQKELARISLSGISAYERGEDGLLCAIRICDYANYERTIDWTKTPVSKEEAMQMNFVKEFPEGVGRKRQDRMYEY